MAENFLTKVFGSKNERELKRIRPVVEKISALESQMQSMNDETLKAQTKIFKDRLNKDREL